MSTSPDAELTAAGEKMRALHVEQQAAHDEAEILSPRTPRHDEIWQQINARTGLYLAAVGDIIATPAAGLAGIEAKARAVIEHLGPEETSTTQEDRLSLSLAKDVLRLIEARDVSFIDTLLQNPLESSRYPKLGAA